MTLGVTHSVARFVCDRWEACSSRLRGWSLQEAQLSPREPRDVLCQLKSYLKTFFPTTTAFSAFEGSFLQELSSSWDGRPWPQ